MTTTVNPVGDRTPIAGQARRPELQRTAEERLWRSGYLALRDIACVARDDEVYLHGRLPSYYLKQVAQEIVAGVEGVRRLINKIDVSRPDHPGAG